MFDGLAEVLMLYAVGLVILGVGITLFLHWLF